MVIDEIEFCLGLIPITAATDSLSFFVQNTACSRGVFSEVVQELDFVDAKKGV